MTISSRKYVLNKITYKNFIKPVVVDRICARYWRASRSCGWHLGRTNRQNVRRMENIDSSRLNGALGNPATCRQQANIYYLETRHNYCNVGKTIHTLGALINVCVCVLHEEEDVSTSLTTWEEAMGDVINTDNLILEDLKIALILNKFLKSWGTFIAMNNSIKSLPNLLTKILNTDIRRQKLWPWLL